ncbi:hypothetical protein BH10CYA1_BH10CYA1_60640 [soil metagenome]
MHKKSILLALSGSEQSYQAAQVAWVLARKTNSCLLAQHVVDTRGAWSFFGCERAGLIGSGMYISTYDTVCQSLKELGKKLAEKYEAMSESQELKSVCVIDEGAPLEEICRRAEDCDLVITGHFPGASAEHNGFVGGEHSQSKSLAEQLSDRCSKPLLIVQGQSKPWTKLKILLSIEHMNFEFVSECLRLSETLGLCPKLICLSSGCHEQTAVQLITNMRAAHPKFSNLTIEIVGVGSGVNEEQSIWTTKPTQVELAASEEDLFVVSTEQIGGKRTTVFGTPTAAFIQALNLPNILFYPEENLANLNEGLDKKSDFDSSQEIVAAHSR